MPETTTDTAQTERYLDSLPLAQALWWFIENQPDEPEQRNALFFHLRARYRREIQGN